MRRNPKSVAEIAGEPGRQVIGTSLGWRRATYLPFAGGAVWRGETAAADVMEIDGGKCQVDGQTGGRINDATRQAIEPHFQERSGAAA